MPGVQVVALQLLAERLSGPIPAADQTALRDQVAAAAPSLLVALSSPDAAVRSAAVGVAAALAASPLLAATTRGTKSKAAATRDAVRAVFTAVEQAADRIAADPGAFVFLLRCAFEEAAGTAEPGPGADAEAGGEAAAGSGSDMDEEDRCAEGLPVICLGRHTRSNLKLRRSHNDTPDPARWLCLVHCRWLGSAPITDRGTVATTTL